MDLDHNYIIKLSFIISLLGILMLLILLNRTQPNNNKINAQSDSEEVKITARVLGVTNNSAEYRNIKLEIKKNITGIIKEKEVNKAPKIKTNEILIVTGTLRGDVIFIDSIKRLNDVLTEQS